MHVVHMSTITVELNPVWDFSVFSNSGHKFDWIRDLRF